MNVTNLSENQRRLVRPVSIFAAVIAFSIGLAYFTAGSQTFPQPIIDRFPFVDAVNAGQDWLRQHFMWFTRGIAAGIRYAIDTVETFLVLLAWPILVLGIALPALKFGGLRMALFCSAAVMMWGCLDLWDSAIETMTLMAVSVFIAGFLGILTGIAASQSNRFEAAIRPVLDTMQTLPGFVYLLPAIFFFGIGAVPSVIAILIYALPPAARLTNLGIRQVSAETIEAAQSFGSSRLQLLFKVKLPIALPSIMMGLNQTIMMALALVVLATFIGAGGLGYEVWVGIRRLKFGQALEGGIAILLMAIVFDRITTAMSLHQQGDANRTSGAFRLLPSRFERYSWAVLIENGLDLIYQLFSLVSVAYTKTIARGVQTLVGVQSRSLASRLYRAVLDRTFLITGLTLLIVLYLIDGYLSSFGSFPSSLEFSIRKPSDAALNAMTTSTVFIGITTWIRWFVFTWMLDPLADFLIALPWWYVIALLSLAVWLSCSRGTAMVCVFGLFFIGAAGIWAIGMFSMAQILVSLLLCMMIGIPIGILAGISNTFEAIIRPILDAMQTLPAFVYLVPVLMFFGGNVVSAVIAIVIYSLPPIIRLTNLGIRGVSSEAVEASVSFGSTFRQTLFKVRIPLALPSIMMGVNQSVMMMLAMLIITPLIGGGGLGREVFVGLSQSDTGWSLQAGLGIVFFAVVLDRLTQSWSTRRQQALGLDVSA